MIKKILFLICFLHSILIHAQTIYYVDGAGGSNSNTGTSLLQAWKTIQKACDAATPNSIVEIKAGTYYENLVLNVSGTAGNPITFRNYQNDSVFIDGTGTAGTTLMSITDQNYLTFDNLVFQNLTVNNAQGILAQTSTSGTSTGLRFHNLIIRHINWTANASAIPNSNDNAQAFIVYGLANGMTHLTVDSCQVYSNILGFSEAVSIDGNINGFTVSNCLVHDNTNIGILAAGNYGTSPNPSTDHARHGLITRNTCFNNVSLYATSAGIYIDGGWSVVVDGNKSYGNGSGIELGCEQNGTTDSITVKNNIIYNNQYTGLAIGGYTTATTGQVTNSLVRNNTFFHNTLPANNTGEIEMSKASNCTIENNVFYTDPQNILFTADSIAPQLNNTFDYNCWFTPGNDSTNITVQWLQTNYTTFGAYRAGTSLEAHSFYADPLLSNAVLPQPDLHLVNLSPCINRSNPATVISAGETDFDGNPRLNGARVDIGAYEYDLISGMKEDYVSRANLELYPNPASAAIFLRTESSIRNIQLISMEGVVLREWNHVPNLISLDGLPSGIYMVRLITKEGEIICRVFTRQ